MSIRRSLIPVGGRRTGRGRARALGNASEPAVLGRRAPAGRAALDPAEPVVPPARVVERRVRQPLVGVGRRPARQAVAGRAAAGRAQDRLQVAAVDEHEARARADHRCRLVAAAPGGEIVGQAGDQVRRDLDRAEVDRRAQHRQRAGLGELVLERQLHQVADEPGGQVRRVLRPVEEVHPRQVGDQQVALHPRPPDAVDRAQPRERGLQPAAVDEPVLDDALLGLLGGRRGPSCRSGWRARSGRARRRSA